MVVKHEEHQQSSFLSSDSCSGWWLWWTSSSQPFWFQDENPKQEIIVDKWWKTSHALWLLTSTWSRTFAASAAVAITPVACAVSSRADADSSFSISCRIPMLVQTSHSLDIQRNCHKVVVFLERIHYWGLLFTQEFHDLSVDVCLLSQRRGLHSMCP